MQPGQLRAVRAWGLALPTWLRNPWRIGCAACIIVFLLLVWRVVALSMPPQTALPAGAIDAVLIAHVGVRPASGGLFAIDLKTREATKLSADVGMVDPQGNWACRSQRVGKPQSRGTRRELDEEWRGLWFVVITPDGPVYHSAEKSPELIYRSLRLDGGHVHPHGVIGATDDKHVFITIDVQNWQSTRHPAIRPQRSWCFAEEPNTILAETGLGIQRIGGATGNSEIAQPGKAPACGPHGEIAWVVGSPAQPGYPRSRRIGVRTPDGAETEFPGPGAEIASLRWAPDGQYLLYTYARGLLGLKTRLCKDQSWGLGALDTRTGNHYRILPGDYSGLEVGSISRGSQAFQCTEHLDPGLLEQLTDPDIEKKTRDGIPKSAP